MTKNGAKWPKIPKFWIWWVCMMKIIGNHAWKQFRTFSGFFDHFWSIFVFSLKNHDFSKKNFKGPKINRFEPRNLVGCVFHQVLMINQWNKPEKGGVRKSVPEKCKSSQTFTLNVFWIFIMKFLNVGLWCFFSVSCMCFVR